MSAWGGHYADYTWASQAKLVSSDASTQTYEISLGTLKAGTATVYQINYHYPDGTALDQNFIASAQLTGFYGQGEKSALTGETNPVCPATTVPPAPVITPEPCVIQLAGQTQFPYGAGDVQVRDKWDDNGKIVDSATQEGEINSDGWGNPAARDLRMYAGVDQAVTNVDIVFTLAQGATFTTVSTPLTGEAIARAGLLYANGYVNPATGIGTPVLSADGKTVTVHVDSMPAHSAIILNAGTTSTQAGQTLVLNSTLRGDKVDCTVLPAVDAIVIVDPCGPDNAYWKVPANTDAITWTLNDDKELVATANPGYIFADGKTVQNYGKATAKDSNEPCPTTTM